MNTRSEVAALVKERLDRSNIEYIPNWNASYRISNLDVDFYIPQSKGLIIIEDDDFMHKVYEDISMAARFSGYKVQIIPAKYIESDENLSVYLGDVLVPVPQSEEQ